APNAFDYLSTHMQRLMQDQGVSPAFPGSVFTTAEITSCDAPNFCRFNEDAAFDTFEAITFLGRYDHTCGGHIIFPDINMLFEVPVGSTYLIPSGARSFNFTAIRKKEYRYMFRQFVSAGVLRWVEKGGRTDAEFDVNASVEERAAWMKMRSERGKSSLKMFSRLSDFASA
ncbi:hypothetical protein R3P38DRAFT_2500714, partial [Favolaschia claudopus]